MRVYSYVAGGSMSSTLLKSCFSCGDDPSQVQEGMPFASPLTSVN